MGFQLQRNFPDSRLKLRAGRTRSGSIVVPVVENDAGSDTVLEARTGNTSFQQPCKHRVLCRGNP